MGFVAKIADDRGWIWIIGQIFITELLKNKWINIIKFCILLFFYFFTVYFCVIFIYFTTDLANQISRIIINR